jgi:2-polyprenyl-3-methyl-5-hydroxy-6-metoxy-1,4-benzoquinol methylase
MTDQALRERRRDAYETPRPEVQELVPRGARRILDLGCASGALGAALKQRQGAEVVGVELMAEYAREAEHVLDRVVCGDVAEALARDDLGTFDCVIAADVLEHLLDPWAVLARAASLLSPGGTVVVSLPNVQYLKTFMELAKGSWPRDDAGLFDRTHLRWFTMRDARALLEQAGCEVTAVVPRYWFHGTALRVARRLGDAGLAPFLAGQIVLQGRRRA